MHSCFPLEYKIFSVGVAENCEAPATVLPILCVIESQQNFWISIMKSGCVLDKTIKVAMYRINLMREESIQLGYWYGSRNERKDRFSRH